MEKYKEYGFFEMEELSHKFPEWRNPGKEKRVPVEF